MRRPATIAAIAVAAIVAVVGLGRLPASEAAAATVHHAAVVVDTSDGKVRRFCLAFPEESISGAEALRRIESEAVFATYGGKGQAVCALCGVGCPSGDCFCDRSKFWAYHRAGPGGANYEYSRAGASATAVRDGDVEGWKWGTGAAPPAGTVGEICGVAEPPVRAASGGSAVPSTTTTAPTADEGSTDPTTSPTAGAVPTTAIAPPQEFAPAAPPPPSPPPPTPLGAAEAPTTPSDPPTVTTSGAGYVAAPPPATSGSDPSEEAVAPTPNRSEGLGVGALAAPVTFVLLLGGILLWRARLRRGNVRRSASLR